MEFDVSIYVQDAIQHYSVRASDVRNLIAFSTNRIWFLLLHLIHARTIGHEPLGEIVEVGDGVTKGILGV